MNYLLLLNQRRYMNVHTTLLWFQEWKELQKQKQKKLDALFDQPDFQLRDAEKELKLAKIKQEGLRDRMRKIKGGTEQALEEIQTEERKQVLLVNQLTKKVAELSKLLPLIFMSFKEQPLKNDEETESESDSAKSRRRQLKVSKYGIL